MTRCTGKAKFLIAITAALLLVSGQANAASAEAKAYHRAVSATKKLYDACQVQLNRRQAGARKACADARQSTIKADQAYGAIAGADRKKDHVPALRNALVTYKKLIKQALAALGTGQAGNQTLALAGGSSGRLSADQLPASAYENQTTSADTALAGASSARVAATQPVIRKDAGVVSFHAEDFHRETIRREIHNVVTFHRTVTRLQVDAFAAGDVEPGNELGYAAVCGQWMEWLLRREDINPLKIASFAWGHLDAYIAQFPWYFPAESGSTAGNAPYCVVGLTLEGIHSWNQESLGKVAIYMTPESSAPEWQISDLASHLGESPERLSVEIMGHADGPGSEAEITQYAQTCADSLVQSLTSAGVEPSRLVTQSYGNARIGYGNSTSDRPWSCAVTVRDLLVLE